MAYTVTDARTDLDRIAADPVGGFMHRDTAARLADRLAELEAMEQRARGMVDDGHPADAAVACYILGEA